MKFRLTVFSLKNKSSHTLDKNVLKLRSKGCLTEFGNTSFKYKCVKNNLVQRLKRKLHGNCILYCSLLYFEVPDGKKFIHINETF